MDVVAYNRTVREEIKAAYPETWKRIEDRRTYMKEEKFSKLLSTSLHELTHKYGGDESENFSYKLTDVMQKVFEAINSNPNLAIQLKILEKAWNAQK